jgi:anhydro-N-acetylmuramic acid kinase
MIVAGVMSGTSADGINVAVVRVTENQVSAPGRRTAKSVGQDCPTHTGRGHAQLELLGHAEFPYPAAVRRMVLAAMNSNGASVAALARLNFLLGELYAEAVLAAQKKLRLKADLAGCHGQTLYHQGTPAVFLGRKLAVTWQTGEGAVIAARVGIPVVSDFRPGDMAAGGKGAPLVPYLDYILYRDSSVGRIAQNIGGIANLTAIPAGASLDQIIAFDTGPGNMVMDALMEQLFSKRFDRDGRVAASGRVLEHVVAHFLRGIFFRQRPPKTAGREEFGREFAREFRRECGTPGPSKDAKSWAAHASAARETPVWGRRGRAPVPTPAFRVVSSDVIATATAFTARSIRYAVEKFVLPGRSYAELIVSGGGARNPTLMAGLANELRDLGLRLRSSDEFGIPSAAKEAVAFALLAFETWNRRPSNVSSATGARRPAILGKISYP